MRISTPSRFELTGAKEEERMMIRGQLELFLVTEASPSEVTRSSVQIRTVEVDEKGISRVKESPEGTALDS